MLSKRLIPCCVFLLLLPQFYHCDDESKKVTDVIDIKESAKNGSKSTGKFFNSLSPEFSWISAFTKDYDVMMDSLVKTVDIPVTGFLPAIVLVLRQMFILQSQIVTLLSSSLQVYINVLLQNMGKLLDILIWGLIKLPRNMNDFLGKFPWFLGGNWFKSIANKIDMCEMKTPFSLYSDKLRYMGGCATKHVCDLLESINIILEELVKKFTNLANAISEMGKKSLKELPKGTIDVMKSEYSQVPGLLSALGKPLAALVKLLPGLLTCILKSVPPSLSRAIKIPLLQIKCLFSHSSKAKTFVEKAEEVKLKAQEALDMNTVKP